MQHYRDLDDDMHEDDTINLARKFLVKLSVADLRVLARMYWKIDASEANKIGKGFLIEDLAIENGREILDAMWRNR